MINKIKRVEKIKGTARSGVVVFDHAKVDTSHCLTDGLFRPLSKKPSKESLNVKHKYKGFTINWINYCRLSIKDQSVFLAVLRIASEKARINCVDDAEESKTMAEVREALKLEKDAAKGYCVVINTSLCEIAKAIGLTDGGANLKMIKRSLIKLSCVSLIIYKGDDIADAFYKTNLISELAGVDGDLHIGINPMLGKALAGGQFTHVSMAEQRALTSDVSKRMHVWLASWMRDGHSRKIELDKLVPHVWGEDSTYAQLRKRRLTMRSAIAELNNLGTLKISEIDKYIIVEKVPQ